ncbi:MAG TPA: DEAD/DEAH box helicase family protein [Gemmatimonadaceae bacterium]|nr:DEAD/DEAH box helicase family protein [Gemmatimonadaceae bacterium]
MSLQLRIAEQVLKVDDAREATEAVVHKYDAFLNLLCPDHYSFQRDAVRESLRFLVSDKYPDLERLARENWNAYEAIQQRHERIDAYFAKMPLRDRKSASIDLATGTGKSFVMYALAAIALAERVAERVLVLCPSLTIEEALLEKFVALAGNSELAGIMNELGAAVTIPAIKRGNETILSGDICVENIHAVYENTGSSIRDSFRGHGGRTLVLNDEAHHLFSPPDRALTEWMKFLQHTDFGFRLIVNVTGTPYVANDYFPDVVFRYGLKQAVADKVVKKPNYKLKDTHTAHDWEKTYAIHRQNKEVYGAEVKPISIVVTQEIARCVEVWRELVDFLCSKERLDHEAAQRKAIWVTSGVPSSGPAKARVESAYSPREDKDSPEKRRKENLASLKHVDDASSSVEWIVSVSMLTEGWDVKNVFQVVPHESRAFSSKLLIAQVLGRGLRVPPGLSEQPLLTINNHEAWSEEVGNMLKEVLEVENTLSWGYDPRRSKFVFPLHNLNYEPEQRGVEVKREKARAPEVNFLPQERKTTEYSTFSETGTLAVEIQHHDLYEIEDAASLVRLFLREKDEALALAWPKKRLKDLIVSQLKAAGQHEDFLSKENLLLLQQGFGPMLRELDKQHPRVSQTAKKIIKVDLTTVARQSFSESTLTDHGSIWTVREEPPPYGGHELHLWEQYQRLRKQFSEYGDEASDQAKAIGSRIQEVEGARFKLPWNVHFVTHEPERRFSDLLFENASLFDSFAKMPNTGGYAFPYSYKPAKSAKTHVANESFNPDFFIKMKTERDILVVEIKAEGDDSNRNRAKCRDGLRHFETLNDRLTRSSEPWRYHFYFLSPDDYTSFFERVRNGNYAGWRSGLMQELNASA